MVFSRNPLAQMEEEKREHDLKMKKMEAEMEQVFEMKVKEKKQKLKDSELELTRRHEERKKVMIAILDDKCCVGMVIFKLSCRLWKFLYVNWRTVNVVSNRRNTNGKIRTASHWTNFDEEVLRPAAKSEYPFFCCCYIMIYFLYISLSLSLSNSISKI